MKREVGGRNQPTARDQRPDLVVAAHVVIERDGAEQRHQPTDVESRRASPAVDPQRKEKQKVQLAETHRHFDAKRIDGKHAEIAQIDKGDDEHQHVDFVEHAAIAHRLYRVAVYPRQEKQDQNRGHHRQHPVPRIGDGAQHRVKRREIPQRRDVLRRQQRVGLDKVVVLEKIAAHLGRVEHDQREQQQEHHGADDVLDRIVGMKRNAVARLAVGAFVFFDLDAVGVVRADLVQRHDVHEHQADQQQRQRDDVERKEAVQGGVGDDVIAAYPHRQVGADIRNRAEQVDDHLGAPVRHLPPRQQITHEGLGHQRHIEQHADDPQQLARLLERTVDETAKHVQVDDDEKGRGPGRVHVADQPPPLDVAHDVLDRRERKARRRACSASSKRCRLRSALPAPAARANRRNTTG